MGNTYANNDKVKACPDAGEVSEEAEGNPLEEHLHGEEDGKHHIDNLQDELELLVVLQVDVLEAEGEAATKVNKVFFQFYVYCRSCALFRAEF
jgi:hypothetical protein